MNTKDYNACVAVSDINITLTEITNEIIEDYIDILYDDYLCEMYSIDPRFYGSDWDYYA